MMQLKRVFVVVHMFIGLSYQKFAQQALEEFGSRPSSFANINYKTTGSNENFRGSESQQRFASSESNRNPTGVGKLLEQSSPSLQSSNTSPMDLPQFMLGLAALKQSLQSEYYPRAQQDFTSTSSNNLYNDGSYNSPEEYPSMPFDGAVDSTFGNPSAYQQGKHAQEYGDRSPTQNLVSPQPNNQQPRHSNNQPFAANNQVQSSYSVGSVTNNKKSTDSQTDVCPNGTESLNIRCDPKRPWPQCPPQSYCYSTGSVDIGPYFCCTVWSTRGAVYRPMGPFYPFYPSMPDDWPKEIKASVKWGEKTNQYAGWAGQFGSLLELLKARSAVKQRSETKSNGTSYNLKKMRKK